MSAQGSKDNPLYMAFKPAEIKPADLVKNVLLTAVPVFIVILIQKPALRQMLTMRVYHYAKTAAQWQADAWQKIADNCATGYSKAKM